MGKLTDFVKAVWDLRSTPIVDDSFPRKRDMVDLATSRMAHIVNENFSPRIVVLCGSSKFFDDFLFFSRQETMAGNIVVMPGVFIQSHRWVEVMPCDFHLSAKEKEDLDRLHLRKIDIADEILVINVDGYVGESTAKEIHYAQEIGIPVRYAFP